MKLLYNFCFLLFSFVGNGQKILKGVVLNAGNNKPVSNATVFINAASIGTTADEQGNFILKIPDGRCVLIVTSAGFETSSQIITTTDLPDLITVNLQMKTKSLQKTVYEKNGWVNWGNFFLINFIGSSANAKNCKIKNTKAIHFYVSEERNEVSADADEPLIIENKALGYTIKYYLNSFLFNFETLLFSYRGYSFFQPMEGSTDKQKIWEKNRSDVYFGSMMHFMRSVYRNQIEEEGFNVRPLKKVRSIPSYQTELADSDIKTKDSTQTVISNNMDDYRDQILNEDNYRDVIGITLSGDSIAYIINETTIGLDFNNFLLITYKEKETPIEYQQQMNGTSMTSQLILINKRPIEIESNGSYYDTEDLMVLGYWTWAQKIANILPFDYNPPGPK
jgi:hypothetical protein